MTSSRKLYGIELSAENGQQNHGQNPSGSERVAVSSTEPCISFLFLWTVSITKVREDGRILSRAAYIVLGVTVEGYKDILSITVGANETSKILARNAQRPEKPWRAGCPVLLRRPVSPDLKTQFRPFFPQAQIQRCVIHMLRNSFKICEL